MGAYFGTVFVFQEKRIHKGPFLALVHFAVSRSSHSPACDMRNAPAQTSACWNSEERDKGERRGQQANCHLLRGALADGDCDETLQEVIEGEGTGRE